MVSAAGCLVFREPFAGAQDKLAPETPKTPPPGPLPARGEGEGKGAGSRRGWSKVVAGTTAEGHG